MTDANFTPISVIQPPNLTTAQISALGDGPQGAIFYDTTQESFTTFTKNLIKRFNQPYHFSGSDTSQVLAANGTATVAVALDKKGYTGGWAILRSPKTVSSATGKAGVICTIRGGISSGVMTSGCFDAYNSVFNSAAGDSYYSEVMFSTLGGDIKLQNAYLASTGSEVVFSFKNTTGSIRGLSVYYAGWVY